MTKKTNLTSDLLTIIEESKKDKTKAYDTQAEVTRVEGSTAWVHIPGGIDETPVKKTISAKAGDKVQVRVAGGTAWLVGNATNPPTDDTAALRAEASADKANEMATSATRSANMAAEAASSATSAASTALSKAEEAEDAAAAASTAAATADQKATAAGTAAAAAQSSADNAATAAATADSKATAASAAATRAETKADTASAAASRAESSASTASQAASQAVSDAAAAQTAANSAGQAASRAQAAADAAQGDIDDQQEYFWHDALGAHVLSDTDEVTGNRYRTDLKGAGQEIFELNGTTETSVATFGADGARLGETGGAHSIIDEDGQRFYADDGTTELANIGYGQGASESGAAVAPYYTFGKRVSGSQIGNYSHAEGNNTIASGPYAHAEGEQSTNYSTEASGIASHAEGIASKASGRGSHAEGIQADVQVGASVVPFQSTASGGGSHSEGGGCSAGGDYSHAQNYLTEAGYAAQTAIGKYNDNNQNNAFEIGNGSGNNSRSNAFEVDWNGNTTAAGDITDGSGNVLSDKADASAIPTVNNATLTIQKNGTNVQTFTANASSNKTANITVPTKTSDLTNDSGFITSIPTPSARTATNTSAYSLTASAAKVTLANKVYCGTNTSISSGGIKCAVAGTVEVSCTARFYPVNDGDLCRLDIYKGSSSQYFSAGRAGGNTENISISPVLLDVAAGDVIYLYAQNGTAARGSISANSAFLTVKYIDE